MNKTLLLIICDFLLLNLLALTRWEKAEPVRPSHAPVPKVATAARTTEQDLVETMRLSLADEQSARNELASQLAARDQNINQLETDRSRLSATLESTQLQATDLGRKLEAANQDAATNQARLSQIQRELDLKKAEADRQKEALAALEKAQREAREKIEGLNVAVKVAEQEKVLLRQTADTLKQQVELERQERQKVHEASIQLAQGVGQLAEKSGELTREIRDKRPINTNTLFNEFLSNRVSVTVKTERGNNFLGPLRRSSSTASVLVTDGSQVYALFHIWETPFGFQELATDYDRITVEIQHGERRVEASTLSFVSLDPRILIVPLDASQVAALGCKVYPLALDILKFPDAMLVNRGGKGYGEVPFKLEKDQPAYVRMDNRLFRWLSGEFSPSRGDLVFSRSGELLGIMVSSDYCGVLNAIVASRTIKLPDTSSQGLGRILNEMDGRLRSLPFRMQ